MASPMNGDECVLAADVEERLSPSPWQEKRGEVKIMTGSLRAERGRAREGPSFCHLIQSDFLPAAVVWGLE